MAYDLVSAASVFQAFGNEALRDMLHEWVIAYSPPINEHVNHVHQVRACL